MDQNQSLYEDKLQFYLIGSPDDSQLSEHMQFARQVFGKVFFFIGVFLVMQMNKQ